MLIQQEKISDLKTAPRGLTPCQALVVIVKLLHDDDLSIGNFQPANL